jgi:hypothetical protein
MGVPTLGMGVAKFGDGCGQLEMGVAKSGISTTTVLAHHSSC